MLSAKEIYSPEFFSFVTQEYEHARHFLKNCGKPKNELDRFWIDFYRGTVRICKKILNN